MTAVVEARLVIRYITSANGGRDAATWRTAQTADRRISLTRFTQTCDSTMFRCHGRADHREVLCRRLAIAGTRSVVGREVSEREASRQVKALLDRAGTGRHRSDRRTG
jgi:hypothetical protein